MSFFGAGYPQAGVKAFSLPIQKYFHRRKLLSKQIEEFITGAHQETVMRIFNYKYMGFLVTTYLPPHTFINYPL